MQTDNSKFVSWCLGVLILLYSFPKVTSPHTCFYLNFTMNFIKLNSSTLKEYYAIP